MKKRLALLAFSLSLLMSCAPKPDSRILAKVGNEYLTENELKYAVEAKPSPRVYDPKDVVSNQPMFENLYESKILRIAAQQAKVDKDPYLSERWINIEKRIMEGQLNQNFTEEAAEIPEKQLQEYYAAHPEKFKSDSGKVIPYSNARSAVADSILVLTANLDSLYEANKEDYKVMVDSVNGHIPPKDSLTDRLKIDYVRRYRVALRQSFQPRLFKKYNLEMQNIDKPITEAELKAYYDANPDKSAGKAMYDVYQIETDQKKSIETALKGIKDLAGFKTAAIKLDQNIDTKKDSGFVGQIKNGNSLPYGIGMFPALFTELDSLANVESPFKITSILENPQTKKWHVFLMTQYYAPKQKEFSRVKTELEKEYVLERKVEVEPATVLATFKGGQIKESDVIFLRKEIPAHYQKRYTREDLIKFLANWEIAYLECQAMGMLADPSSQYLLNREKDRYWARIYQDSILAKNYGFDSTKLRETFNAKRELFVPADDSSGYSVVYNHDIATYLLLDPKEFEIEYQINNDMYYRDSVLVPFKEAQYQIFQNLKRTNYRIADDFYLNKIKNELKAEILADEFKPKEISDPMKAYAEAQKLHGERKLAEAQEMYEKIRKTFPKNDGLQDSLCMSIAQLLIEQERYAQAIAEYRRLLLFYPNSANNYKAQFMIGFIYAENLKQDKKAVVVFKELLQKWPKSDLSDDADWMIRNIESGGALMPKLEGVEPKTEEVAPATTAPEAKKEEAKPAPAKEKKNTAPKTKEKK